MLEVFAKIGLKFLSGKWTKIIPTLLRAIAEGKLGEPAKKLYWALEGKKFWLGAAMVGLAYGFEAICNANPDMAWGCQWSGYVRAAGALLASVGLIDGGVRSPWPTGTLIPPEEKQ